MAKSKKHSNGPIKRPGPQKPKKGNGPITKAGRRPATIPRKIRSA